ncbi:MAG: hypothetical protein R2681_10075 [Pyrinomonadaceae bacterium]
MKKTCHKCGQENLAEAAFCRNCSAPLGGAPSAGGTGEPLRNQQNFADQQNTPQTSRGPSTQAYVALGLVVASLLCCGLTAAPGAVVGWLELGAIKRGDSPQDGLMMAQIGLWGGLAVTILSVIGIFLYLLVAIASVNSDPYAF